jgi:hypothetical protein
MNGVHYFFHNNFSLVSCLGSSSSTRVTQMFTARQECFPRGGGNYDVHKITHSAESERFEPYG